LPSFFSCPRLLPPPSFFPPPPMFRAVAFNTNTWGVLPNALFGHCTHSSGINSFLYASLSVFFYFLAFSHFCRLSRTPSFRLCQPLNPLSLPIHSPCLFLPSPFTFPAPPSTLSDNSRASRSPDLERSILFINKLSFTVFFPQ